MSDHPSDEVLGLWLETAKPSRVGRHLEECDRCLDRLDELSDLGGGLRSELDSVSAPPIDLRERTTGGVRERLAAEEAAAAFAELFALPWRTMSVLVDPSSPIGETVAAEGAAMVDSATTTSDDSHEDGEN